MTSLISAPANSIEYFIVDPMILLQFFKCIFIWNMNRVRNFIFIHLFFNWVHSSTAERMIRISRWNIHSHTQSSRPGVSRPHWRPLCKVIPLLFAFSEKIIQFIFFLSNSQKGKHVGCVSVAKNLSRIVQCTYIKSVCVYFLRNVIRLSMTFLFKLKWMRKYVWIGFIRLHWRWNSVERTK